MDGNNSAVDSMEISRYLVVVVKYGLVAQIALNGIRDKPWISYCGAIRTFRGGIRT